MRVEYIHKVNLVDLFQIRIELKNSTLSKITEYKVSNCIEFTDTFPLIMTDYYSNQTGLFNVSIR